MSNNNDLDSRFVEYGEEIGRKMILSERRGVDPYTASFLYKLELDRLNNRIKSEFTDPIDRNFRTGDANIGLNFQLVSNGLKPVRITRN
jgi:hypothetical protein